MAEPYATDAEATPTVVDPATGLPIGATATMTFAEWCAVEQALVDADVATFDQFYKPAEVVPPAVEAPRGSAFARYYGTGAEQKMDRGTLEARIAHMVAALEANPPPVPPPVEDPPAA